MKKLLKEELIKLYETLPEDTLRKLGIYGKAKEAHEEKQKLEKLKKERIERVMALVKEAQELLNIYRLELNVTSRGIRIKDKDGRDINKIGDHKKLRRGSKTPQFEYRIPILQVLIDLEGRGTAKEILERVYKKMKDVLNSVDLETLPSGRDFRWRNTTMWERNTMVNEGLLEKDSPRGIWEITEKGKIYLKEHLNE
jgi:intein/homing endonuclease